MIGATANAQAREATDQQDIAKNMLHIQITTYEKPMHTHINRLKVITHRCRDGSKNCFYKPTRHSLNWPYAFFNALHTLIAYLRRARSVAEVKKEQ